MDRQPATACDERGHVIEPGMIEAEIPHLRRYARALLRDREAADDLVQDTLERAWRKRHLWRPQGRLRGWLFRVLYRLYLDGHPAPRRHDDKLIALDTIGLDPRDRRASNGLQLHCRDVLAAMDRLSPEHRAILMLAGREQPSYREGARMLGIRVGTFRSRLSRARQQLNALLDADPDPNTLTKARAWDRTPHRRSTANRAWPITASAGASPGRRRLSTS